VIKIEKNETCGTCSTYGEVRHIQGFGGKTCGKENTLETPGVDGRLKLRWIFRKWDVSAWTGSSWLRIGQVAGPCE